MGLILLFFSSQAFADFNDTLCDRAKYQVDVGYVNGELTPKYLFGVEKEYVCLTIRSDQAITIRIDSQPVALSVRERRVERIAFRPYAFGEYRIKINGRPTRYTFTVSSALDRNLLEKSLRRGANFPDDQGRASERSSYDERYLEFSPHWVFIFYTDIKFLLHRSAPRWLKPLTEWWTTPPKTKHDYLMPLMERRDWSRINGPIQVFVYLKPDLTYKFLIFDKRFQKLQYDFVYMAFRHVLVVTIVKEYNENSVAQMMLLFQEHVYKKLKLEVEVVCSAEGLDDAEIGSLFTQYMWSDVKAHA